MKNLKKIALNQKDIQNNMEILDEFKQAQLIGGSYDGEGNHSKTHEKTADYVRTHSKSW